MGEQYNEGVIESKEFEVEISNFAKFKSFVQAVSGLVAEGSLKATAEGLKFALYEQAGSAMVYGLWGRSDFARYVLPEGTEKNFKISIADLKVFISKIKEGKITLTVNNKFYILIEGAGSKKRYALPLIDQSDSEGKKGKPALTFDSSIVMKSDKFKEMIEDLSSVAESMGIHLTAERVSFISEDLARGKELKIDFNESTITPPAPVEIMSPDGKPSGKFKIFSEASRYSTEYMLKLVEGAKVAPSVIIEFKHDYPIRLTFATDNLSLTYILAPRVENE